MLPDVIAEDREIAFHERAVLVLCRGDLVGSVRTANEPDPPAPKARRPGGVELLLEVLESAEILVDHIGNGSGRFPPGIGAHNLPEHAVVDGTTAVVDDGLTDILRHLIDISEKILCALIPQLRMLLDG